jgi:hypothetical protein
MPSEGGIILPGDVPIDRAKLAAAAKSGGGISPAALAQAEKEGEGKALDEEVAFGLNLGIEPPDDALICPFGTAPQPRPTQTKHHGVVNLPDWARPRCVQAHCGMWVPSAQACTFRLQGELAGLQLQSIKAKLAATAAGGKA